MSDGKPLSIVRQNLLKDKTYRPYCGADQCRHRWPRTRFNGKQFVCRCGWKSNFEPEFIKQIGATADQLRPSRLPLEWKFPPMHGSEF